MKYLTILTLIACFCSISCTNSKSDTVKCTIKSVKIDGGWKSTDDESEFLNDFIERVQLNESTVTYSQKYYEQIVKDKLPKEYFKKGNIKFDLKVEEIKNYGKCHVGHFLFNDYYGVDQGNVYIMINGNKKEAYIFYFQNLFVKHNGCIDITLNVRGNEGIYTLCYIKE